MSEPLPVLLSIPHGGTETPPALAAKVVISPQDLFDDGDALTPLIYDLGAAVTHVVSATLARAFVDLNRDPTDRPPNNPDGVVKTATCYNRPIYRSPLSEAEAEDLIDRYHRPYHDRLQALASRPGLQLGVDCHSMAPSAPPIAPTPGTHRPLFCLSDAGGTSAPRALTQRLAAAIACTFEVDPSQVLIDEPFQGGYITRRHGGAPLPWIQVEMNRRLYLAPPWFDPDSKTLQPERAEALRASFRQALQQVV